MNNLKIALKALALTIILVSCSSDDDNNNNQDSDSRNNFPLTINNYWNYDVTNTNLNTNAVQVRRDSLYVATNNANRFTLAINGIAYGTMNSILTQTALTRVNNTLQGSGTIVFPFGGLEDLDIAVNNAVFYNLDAAPGALLSETVGTIEQTVENLPINVSYAFRTIQGSFSESLPLQGLTYINVSKSTIELELKITTEVEVIPGNIVTITILDTQNILDIENYYAENIGLIRSEADISYQFEDFSQIGVTLPFPATVEATSLQELDTYEVADE